MRIFVLPSWYPNEADPVAGIFIRDQVEVLRREHEVAVILVSPPGTVTIPDGDTPVFREAFSSLVPGPDAALRAYLAAARKVLERAAREVGPPDLVHAHVGLPAGWAAAEACRDVGPPVVLTEHLGPFDPRTQSPRQLSRVRTAFQGARIVVAVSPTSAREIRDFVPGVRVRVVGDVVRSDCGPHDRSVRMEPGRILSVGLLTQVKGFDLLIDAIRLVIERVPDANLHLVGDGDLRGPLEERATGMPVRFLGTLSRQEIRRELAAAAVFVSSSHYESFGVAMAEALCSGTPVVATRTGGAEYVLGSGGTLVEHLPDAIAAGIIDVLEGRTPFDPQQVGRDALARFGEEAFLRAIGDVYEEAVSGS
jgi:glycosyltransferase involved in cell wall biosynthesis